MLVRVVSEECKKKVQMPKFLDIVLVQTLVDPVTATGSIISVSRIKPFQLICSLQYWKPTPITSRIYI